MSTLVSDLLNAEDNFGAQEWEVKDSVIEKMTPKEKKQFYQGYVDKTQAGNPHIRSSKRVYRFPPPDQTTKERMKYLDNYGNPIAGYKWEGVNIVKDTNYVEKAIDTSKGTFNYVKSENRML